MLSGLTDGFLSDLCRSCSLMVGTVVWLLSAQPSVLEVAPAFTTHGFEFGAPKT